MKNVYIMHSLYLHVADNNNVFEISNDQGLQCMLLNDNLEETIIMKINHRYKGQY